MNLPNAESAVVERDKIVDAGFVSPRLVTAYPQET